MIEPRDPESVRWGDRRALPPVLEGFLAALMLLTGICVLCEAAATLIFHLGPPHASPLLIEHFPDLTSFMERFQYLHQMTFFTMDPLRPYMYPAPVVLPYAFFFHLERPLRGYLVTILGAFLLGTLLLGRALLRRGLRLTSTVLLLAVTLCLSYPLVFLLKQANMEGIIWIILSLGLLLFFSGRSYAAAACFGVAGAMKLFPFVYLGLLLSRRQYRPIAWGLLVGALLTVVSLWVVYPNLSTSWRLIEHGLDQFRLGYMLRLRPLEKGFDHSLWGVIKRLHRPSRPDRLAPYLTAYLVTTALAGVALYLLRIRRMPITNQVLCLAVASILFPPTSFDYTLVHLYAPWTLLTFLAVRVYQEGRRPPPGLVAAMACFAVLMAPETEIIYQGESAGGPIKAVVLLALFYVGLRYPFHDPPSEPGRRLTPDLVDA